MIGIGVIGYGYWGPNLVRNFAQVDGAAVVAVCDASQPRLDVVNKLYPAVSTYTSVTEMLANPAVNAVAIATPVTTHFPLAKQSLEAGRHVFVEKPFTKTSAEGEELIAIADERELTLMVDHTFIYTSAVRKIHDLVQAGDLGRLYYYDSVRVNLGLFQSDVSVMWDLAVHDLSIMDYLLGADPVTVSATGVAHVGGQPENMAYITCMFPDNLIAHFHVNWLAPVKVRQTLLCGSEKMVVFDDVDMSEKVKVYDKGVILDEAAEHVYQRHVGYRTGDMWAPRLDNIEALAVETQHFVDCINTGETPLSDGRAGLRVVRILEAAHESMAQRGLPIEVHPMREAH
ncbi:MAG: Gfo/Idh/MocA family oxidoreductase [Ilumatobacteraceae bacterium]|nr:Gfo/Idh/MocA family oxidoreductase [Ilumatobacteraceae bacterium]